MNEDKSSYICNMKLQMRLILIFVSLSVLGIFFFQGYWLWNSYNIEKQQIRRIINETLQQAINEDLTERMEKMKTTRHPVHLTAKWSSVFLWTVLPIQPPNRHPGNIIPVPGSNYPMKPTAPFFRLINRKTPP